MSPNGYNLTAGGDGTAGLVKSPETLKLMSIIGKKLRHTQATKQKISDNSLMLWSTPEFRKKMALAPKPNLEHQRKAIQQYSPEGVLLNTFESMHEAGRETGISYKNISTVARGLRKYAGGYSWQFLNN